MWEIEECYIDATINNTMHRWNHNCNVKQREIS